MRILYSHRIQSRDGQSVHVEELVAAFRAAGHDVLVVGPSFYDASGFGGESRTIARLRRLMPGVSGELAELAYNASAYLRLQRAYRSFRPDFVYERYNLYYLAGVWLARRYKLPFYLEVNSPLAEERSKFGGLRLTRLAQALERHVWRSATRVLAVTGVLGEMVARAGTPAERIEIVPNGIVLERFPTVPVRPDPRPIVLGFVGFVRDWHGLDGLIEAMARDLAGPPISLTIVGDGPARPGLEQLAAALGIAERVRFTGLVEHADVPAQVAAFDIALQPRVVAYASPLKNFDYMAAGRAIVAPDQPNMCEILEHDRTALLFNPTEDGAMWRAVQRLAADAALRRRLGDAARLELERKDYTWRGNAARIVERARSDAAGAATA